MNNYKVLTPLMHDGKRYEIGETVELDPKVATSLIGVVEPVTNLATRK